MYYLPLALPGAPSSTPMSVMVMAMAMRNLSSVWSQDSMFVKYLFQFQILILNIHKYLSEIRSVCRCVAFEADNIFSRHYHRQLFRLCGVGRRRTSSSVWRYVHFLFHAARYRTVSYHGTMTMHGPWRKSWLPLSIDPTTAMATLSSLIS